MGKKSAGFARGEQKRLRDSLEPGKCLLADRLRVSVRTCYSLEQVEIAGDGARVDVERKVLETLVGASRVASRDSALGQVDE